MSGNDQMISLYQNLFRVFGALVGFYRFARRRVKDADRSVQAESHINLIADRDDASR